MFTWGRIVLSLAKRAHADWNCGPIWWGKYLKIDWCVINAVALAYYGSCRLLVMARGSGGRWIKSNLLPRMEFCCLLFRNFNCLCHNGKSKRTYHCGIISWKSEATDNKNQSKEPIEIVRAQDTTMLCLKIRIMDNDTGWSHTLWLCDFLYLLFFNIAISIAEGSGSFLLEPIECVFSWMLLRFGISVLRKIIAWLVLGRLATMLISSRIF